MKNNIRVMAESALKTGQGLIIVKGKTFGKDLVSTIDVDAEGFGEILRAQDVNKIIKIHSAINLITNEQLYPAKKETKVIEKTTKVVEEEVVEEVEEEIEEIVEEVEEEIVEEKPEMFYCPVEDCEKHTEGYGREQDLKRHMASKHNQ